MVLASKRNIEWRIEARLCSSWRRHIVRRPWAPCGLITAALQGCVLFSEICRGTDTRGSLNWLLIVKVTMVCISLFSRN